MKPYRGHKKALDPHAALKKARKLRKRFTKLDLENPRQVRKLYGDVTQRRRALVRATGQMERRKAGVTEQLNRHEEKEQRLKEREQKIVAQLREAPEEDAEARFQLARQLHSVQLDITMLGREHTDLDLTLQSLRSWLLSLDEAVGIIRLLAQSLERNIERLEICSVVGGDETSLKTCEIVGCVELVGADYEESSEPRLAECFICGAALEVCRAPRCRRCDVQISYWKYSEYYLALHPTAPKNSYAVAHYGNREPTGSEAAEARKRAKEKPKQPPATWSL